MLKIPSDWSFHSTDVASNFDSHVREQLPWYDLVTGAVAHIVRHYLPVGGLMYDIGCSTGNLGATLSETISARGATLIGIEESKEMCAAYSGPGECVNSNAVGFRYEPFDVAVCFLLFMFVQPSQRNGLLASLLERMKLGGAIVIVDKTEPPLGYAGTVMHRLTIAGKIASGADANDVVAKELSLSGIQRPIADGWVASFAPMAHKFFAFGEFSGWLIEEGGKEYRKTKAEYLPT